MSASVYVKVCGVTHPDNASQVADLGVDAIGLNFVPGSKRRVEPSEGRAVCEVVRGRVQVVAVVADMSQSEIIELVAQTRVDRVQLHGSETPELLSALGGLAYKAVRVSGPEDVQRARAFGGDPLLMDALVPGELGGTGHRFDWALAEGLASERRILLAGGLDAGNVAEAIDRVRPWGVDVASGVEFPGRPGEKDPERVTAFVRAARAARGR